MRKLTQMLLIAGVVSAPSLMVSTSAMAEEAAAASPISANVMLASEYVYRGISQTREKLALQGGFDYAHSSGLYVGTWGSNINWLQDAGASSSLELDIYGGYKGKINDDFSYDVGYLRYEYPGSYPAGFVSPNTDELYVSGSYKMFTLKYSHSLSNLFGFANSKNSNYIDASANFDLGNGFGLGLHAGHQKVSNNSDYSYTDYKIGLTKDFGGGLSVSGAYIDTNAKEGAYVYAPSNTKLSDSRFVLSVSKAF
ncbi:MAG: TorF family putative porin [Sulfuricella denitrificans]|nr:TorF family putative porin [Sulfuricella denitrificans]